MKKILTILLTYIFYFNSFSIAHASTANPTIGGWKVNQTTDYGIGKKITATKTAMINGVEVVKTSTAAVIPKANNIGKFLAKNAAMAVAVGALDYLLDGIDYVIDNSNITFTSRGEYSYYNTIIGSFSTKEAFCQARLQRVKSESYPNASLRNIVINSDGKSGVCYIYTYSTSYAVDFPFQIGVVSDSEQRTVPISTIAAQVADKAVEDERRGVISPAVVAARTAAGEMIGEADDDAIAPPVVGTQTTPAEIAKELDKAAVVPSNPAAEGTISTPAVVDPVTGEVKAPPQTSNIALDFPVFCGWAPIVCEVAQTVSETIVAAKEYLKEEPLPVDPTEVEIQEPEQVEKEPDTFSWNASCPFTQRTDDLGFNGTSAQVDSDLSSWCEMASEIRPYVLMGGGWFAFLIVSGFRVGND